MIVKKERRFNRSRDRACAIGLITPSVVAKKVSTEAAKLVRLLTCKYMITELNLRNCFLKKQMVQDIFTAVKYNHTLTSLDLSSNAMGDDAIRALPDVLGLNSILKTLVLQDVDIGNVGAKCLAMALESNSTLEILDVSFNLIGSSGFLWLANYLAANRTLTSLGVRGNPFGLDGLKAVCIALDWSQSLVELDVTDTISNWNLFNNRDGSNNSTASEGMFIVAHLSAIRQYASKPSLERLWCSPMVSDQEIVLSSLLGVTAIRNHTKALAAPRPGQQTFDLCNMGFTTQNWPEAFKETQTFEEATSIGLSGNFLTDIPQQVLGLENLEKNALATLSLANNRLTGKLNSKICRLLKLKVLDLSRNSLTELPAEIYLLTALESLDLRWNQINNDGLPISIFQLKNLRHLLLQRNPLSFVPEEVFKMTRLSNFQLAGTYVPFAHRCILECWSEKKKELDLSSSRLRALPRIIQHLKCLQRLDLRDNELVSLPLEISMLTNLHTLDLRFNLLNNLPWTIGEMSALKVMKLEGNPLGNLPTELVIKDTNFIKSFLLSLKGGQVPCNRMKLMVSSFLISDSTSNC
jgi:Leucine-rich repeat (LRR) protein